MLIDGTYVDYAGPQGNHGTTKQEVAPRTSLVYFPLLTPTLALLYSQKKEEFFLPEAPRDVLKSIGFLGCRVLELRMRPESDLQHLMAL